LTPNELVLTFRFGVLTSVPILVKIDQEMRPWECSQTDRQTDAQTHTQTDANRFYNLSHAICYSYGTDNNWKRWQQTCEYEKRPNVWLV